MSYNLIQEKINEGKIILLDNDFSVPTFDIIVARRRGVDIDVEIRRFILPSFDNEDNLVLLHPNANGIIEGEFLHEEVSVHYDTD